MHLPHLLGAGAAITVLGWLTLSSPPSTPSEPSAPPTSGPSQPPVAAGHHVFVVEGNCNALAITAASRKPDAWAGVPKGFDSPWRLRVTDARGELLVEVPLDMSPFDTDPAAVLRPVRVEGCIVRSSAIGMLVSVPAFDAAANYTFVRLEGAPGGTPLGTTSAERVRELEGGGR